MKTVVSAGEIRETRSHVKHAQHVDHYFFLTPYADATTYFITYKVAGGVPHAQEQEGSLRAATQPPWMPGSGECIVESEIGTSYVDAIVRPPRRRIIK